MVERSAIPERERAARRCLVAACTSLALDVFEGPNERMWLEVIGAVLPDCGQVPDELLALRNAARRLVDAAPGRPRQGAHVRLRTELRLYFGSLAGRSYDGWRGA